MCYHISLLIAKEVEGKGSLPEVLKKELVVLKYFSLSHPYSKLNLLICWFCGISCQSYDAFIFWLEGGAEKRILVGAGEEGKETDKRINERKKLMTNDRLSWVKQSLKSQISNLYFFYLWKLLSLHNTLLCPIFK